MDATTKPSFRLEPAWGGYTVKCAVCGETLGTVPDEASAPRASGKWTEHRCAAIPPSQR